MIVQENYWNAPYLNHFSTFELLYVTEFAGFTDQFASLQIDNALIKDKRKGFRTNSEKVK